MDEQVSRSSPEVRAQPVEQAQLLAENVYLKDQLSTLRAQILRLEGEVRAAVARDLHDGPIQQMAAAGLHLTYLRRVLERAPGMLPEAIDDLDDQLARVMHDLRTALYELRPLGLEEHGLYWALEQYVAKLRGGHALDIRLLVPPGLRRLPVSYEAAVFYIVQEALMNVRKHAGAATATITFADQGTRIRVTIADDGHGFDLPAIEAGYATRGSLGILSMHERTSLIGGACMIATAPGAGTTVTIDIPFTASGMGIGI